MGFGRSTRTQGQGIGIDAAEAAVVLWDGLENVCGVDDEERSGTKGMGRTWESIILNAAWTHLQSTSPLDG